MVILGRKKQRTSISVGLAGSLASLDGDITRKIEGDLAHETFTTYL